MLVGASCVTLLAFSAVNKQQKVCSGLQINITGVSNNFFIDKNDVYEIIKKFGGDTTQQKNIGNVNLKQIEYQLEKDVWIKNAELYFDNNNILNVTVAEREPIARIFTTTGNTFYIDSSCAKLPLSDKFSARLPIFTGFVSNNSILPTADSLLLTVIKNITTTIIADTFLMAMIEQIEIINNHQFEMTPKLGKQKIIFGDENDIETKFEKLKLFYKKVIPQAGWNRYGNINLSYKNQVVASIRGKADIIADSLQTLALMKFIVADAAQKSADSAITFLQDNNSNTADSSMILQSLQRDDEHSAQQQVINTFSNNTNTTNAAITNTVIKPIPALPVKTTTAIVKKPISKQTTTKPTVATVKKPTTVTTKNNQNQPKQKISTKQTSTTIKKQQ